MLVKGFVNDSWPTDHCCFDNVVFYTTTMPFLATPSPSSLLALPSSSWPRKPWTAQPGLGRGWERAECRSTEFPRPHWLWSVRKHLRGRIQKQRRVTAVHLQKINMSELLNCSTHQKCPCNGSAGGLRFWTLPPAASVECWPPTWEWSGSHSQPLHGQQIVSHHESFWSPFGDSTHIPDATPMSRSLPGLDLPGPDAVSFFSALKV